MTDVIPPPPGAPKDAVGVPPPPAPEDSPAPAAPDTAGPAAELEEVPHQLSTRVEGLSCPNCGGNLEIDTGFRVVECPYCGTPLLVKSQIGTRRFAIEPKIGAERARQIAKRWLTSGFNKDSRLGKQTQQGEAFLCFLPFFRVEADAVGFALGTEQRRRTVGSGKNRRVQTYEVNVERKVERSFDRTYPASNVAEWGIQRVDLAGDPLVPFESEGLARKGMVFPPTGSEREVFSAALESFKSSAEPSAGLHRTRFRFLETLRERLTVIYYPLWVVRYHFQKRAYQVLVDAEDGSLAYGKAPGNDLYRALALVATEAAAMFLFTTAVQFAGASFPVLAIGGALGVALFYWGWRRFRYGGVVIEGTGVVEKRSGKGIGKALKRAARTGSTGELLSGLEQIGRLERRR